VAQAVKRGEKAAADQIERDGREGGFNPSPSKRDKAAEARLLPSLFFAYLAAKLASFNPHPFTK
jgi:hypothetical protein